MATTGPLIKVARNTRRLETAVYRLYDHECLLYVGMSCQPLQRFKQHAAMWHWWPSVVRAIVEWYPDRQTAAAAETYAIQTEIPIWNVMGLADHAPEGPPPATPIRDPECFVWGA